jgi:hypothetical protein
MFNNKRLRVFAAVCALLVLAIPAALHAAEGEGWIVFDCNRPNPQATEASYWDIWKLNPDATNVNEQGCDLYGDPLTTDPANEWDPTYSVEDQSVVFVSDKSGWPNLWKVSIDGGYPSGLVFGQYCAVDPCYSFDGAKIAYTSNQTGNWEIYTMNSDGSNKTNITNYAGADDRSPCFSTDGSKVYFISNRDAAEVGDWEIYVVASDGGGTQEKAIINSSGQALLLDYTEHDPCTSPTDDNIIVFTTNVATPTYTDPGIIDEADRINFELFSYNFTTRDTNRLTASWNEYIGYDDKGNPYNAAQLWNSSMPCFSPDGQRIAWSADNWTGTGWMGSFEERPYTDYDYESYWKPIGMGQGSDHQIWIMDKDEDHHYWFPPSFWGWDNENEKPTPYGGYSVGPGHQHHKHYNPSWDYKP